jgi:pyruvate dehydrogenase E2 component (dihydrolipoamide acetyltransferase)
VDVVLPKNSLTMTEAEVIEWYVDEGGTVVAGEPLFLMETEKSQVEVDATASGRLAKVLVPAGQTASAGDVIATLETSDDEAVSLLGNQQVNRGVAPAAADLAKQFAIDIDTVRGSGSGGRVIEEDVLRAVERATPAAEVAAAAATWGQAAEPATRPAQPSRARAAGNRSTLWAAAVPTFQLAVELALPSRPRPDRVTASDLLIAAAASAARAVPVVNACVRDDEVLLYEDVRVGLLVRDDDALVPLVFRDPDLVGLPELHDRRRELMKLVGDGALPGDATAWPTLVISNIGRPGVHWFSAVLYPGTTVTLAIGSVGEQTPDRAQVVLTCDHRALDGVDAANYCDALSDALASR